MNNLYQDLYYKAVANCTDNSTESPIAWQFEKEYARLIVEECIAVCCTDDYEEIRFHFGIFK